MKLGDFWKKKVKQSNRRVVGDLWIRKFKNYHSTGKKQKNKKEHREAVKPKELISFLELTAQLP